MQAIYLMLVILCLDGIFVNSDSQSVKLRSNYVYKGRYGFKPSPNASHPESFNPSTDRSLFQKWIKKRRKKLSNLEYQSGVPTNIMESFLSPFGSKVVERKKMRNHNFIRVKTPQQNMRAPPFLKQSPPRKKNMTKPTLKTTFKVFRESNIMEKEIIGKHHPSQQEGWKSIQPMSNEEVPSIPDSNYFSNSHSHIAKFPSSSIQKVKLPGQHQNKIEHSKDINLQHYASHSTRNNPTPKVSKDFRNVVQNLRNENNFLPNEIHQQQDNLNIKFRHEEHLIKDHNRTPDKIVHPHPGHNSFTQLNDLQNFKPNTMIKIAHPNVLNDLSSEMASSTSFQLNPEKQTRSLPNYSELFPAFKFPISNREPEEMSVRFERPKMGPKTLLVFANTIGTNEKPNHLRLKNLYRERQEGDSLHGKQKKVAFHSTFDPGSFKSFNQGINDFQFHNNESFNELNSILINDHSNTNEPQLTSSTVSKGILVSSSSRQVDNLKKLVASYHKNKINSGNQFRAIGNKQNNQMNGQHTSSNFRVIQLKNTHEQPTGISVRPMSEEGNSRQPRPQNFRKSLNETRAIGLNGNDFRQSRPPANEDTFKHPVVHQNLRKQIVRDHKLFEETPPTVLFFEKANNNIGGSDIKTPLNTETSSYSGWIPKDRNPHHLNALNHDGHPLNVRNQNVQHHNVNIQNPSQKLLPLKFVGANPPPQLPSSPFNPVPTPPSFRNEIHFGPNIQNEISFTQNNQNEISIRPSHQISEDSSKFAKGIQPIRTSFPTTPDKSRLPLVTPVRLSFKSQIPQSRPTIFKGHRNATQAHVFETFSSVSTPPQRIHSFVNPSFELQPQNLKRPNSRPEFFNEQMFKPLPLQNDINKNINTKLTNSQDSFQPAFNHIVSSTPRPDFQDVTPDQRFVRTKRPFISPTTFKPPMRENIFFKAPQSFGFRNIPVTTHDPLNEVQLDPNFKFSPISPTHQPVFFPPPPSYPPAPTLRPLPTPRSIPHQSLFTPVSQIRNINSDPVSQIRNINSDPVSQIRNINSDPVSQIRNTNSDPAPQKRNSPMVIFSPPQPVFPPPPPFVETSLQPTPFPSSGSQLRNDRESSFFGNNFKTAEQMTFTEQTKQPSDEELPKKYEYRYVVKDPSKNVQYGHAESREGQVARGEYFVTLPDGRTQHVMYIADENGYRADVKYYADSLELKK